MADTRMEGQIKTVLEPIKTRLDSVLNIGKAFSQVGTQGKGEGEKTQLTSKQPVRTGESPEDILDHIRDLVVLMNDKMPAGSSSTQALSSTYSPTQLFQGGKGQSQHDIAQQTTLSGGIQDLLKRLVDCTSGKGSSVANFAQNAATVVQTGGANAWTTLLDLLRKIFATLLNIEKKPIPSTSAQPTTSSGTTGFGVPSPILPTPKFPVGNVPPTATILPDNIPTARRVDNVPVAGVPGNFWQDLKDKISSGFRSFGTTSFTGASGATADKFTNVASQGVGKIGSALSGEKSDLGGISDALGGVGKIAGMIPVIGKVAEPALKLTAAFFSATDSVKKWTESLHQSNMRFAEFSGAMAGVQAEQEARDIALQKQQGDARAESARDLAEAKSRLAKAVAPLEDSFAKLKNSIGTFVANTMTNLIDALKTKRQKEIEQQREIDEAHEKDNVWNEATWMKGLGWMERYGTPPDMR